MDLNAFFKMSYGLYVVSSAHEGQMSAYIANTAFQVSSQPPRFGVSTHKENHTTGLIEASGVFCVGILEREIDLKYIGKFGFRSGSKFDKFADTPHRLGLTGAPIVLDKVVAYIECRVSHKLDVGTHLLYIGDAVDAQVLQPDKSPITYAQYRSEVKGLTPKNATTFVPDERKTLKG